MRRTGLLPLLALALTACGTTVPITTQARAGDGLAPVTAAPDGSTTGVALPGSSSTGGTGGTTSTSGGSTGTTGVALPQGSTTTTGTAAPGPTSPGAVRATGPLKLGIVLTGTSNADDLGVSLGNTYSEKEVYDAIIASLNAQGGLGGRRIDPVFASTDTGSNNWEADFTAACATFTQDNKVVAVLGYVFNYSRSLEKCLTAKGIPHLSTGFNIPDTSELAKHPRHVALDVPTIDRRGLVKLVSAYRDGVVSAKNKIGVLSDTCPGTQESLKRTFLPQAKTLGLTVARTISLNCPNGAADASGAVTALQNAVLQFVSAGVDRVVFHATSEGPALLLFSVSAESQGYRPTYVVSSLANLEALRTQLPAAQVKNVHGYGWLPTQDIRPAAYPAAAPLQKRCLALLTSRGIKPTSGPDYYYGYNLCEALFVYERALQVTRGDSDGARVVAAVKGLGTTFPSVTNLGGSLFAPNLPDAPRSARHLLYTDSCSCFVYTGPTRPIPSTVQEP